MSLSLYIHWPFCAAKCPYCDFNAHIRDTLDERRYLAAYLGDLDYWHQQTKGRPVYSVFFGGGTPSLMHPDSIQAILCRIDDLWGLEDACEITLEANPTSSEYQRFQDFRSAGINRLSIGVQALNDNDLRILGRNHNADEALRAIEMARQLYDRFSFDLIYARPQQDIRQWQQELKQAVSLSGGHLSLYQLTIEPGTQFYTLHTSGRMSIPDEDDTLAFYDATQEICEAAGLPAYELSNHAGPGQESRHNMIYWTAGDYIGIGAGAHGRVTLQGERVATLAHHAPEIWLQTAEDTGTGVTRQEVLSPATRLEERLMTGLRLRQGMECPPEIDDKIIASLIAEGLLCDTPGLLRTTKKGRLLVNGIAASLIPD